MMIGIIKRIKTAYQSVDLAGCFDACLLLDERPRPITGALYVTFELALYTLNLEVRSIEGDMSS
jgi:hypothetical protein